MTASENRIVAFPAAACVAVVRRRGYRSDAESEQCGCSTQNNLIHQRLPKSFCGEAEALPVHWPVATVEKGRRPTSTCALSRCFNVAFPCGGSPTFLPTG
jgi:hypothetical protein